MSRKALFASLEQAVRSKFDGQSIDDQAVQPRVNRLRMRPILGATELIDDAVATPIGAIGQSLGEFTAKAKRADDIERKLAEGLAVVDLDPSLIDPSFVSDRMPATADAQAKFVEVIREHGQQVPILVRPHPEAPGRYQVAYGHRRLRALGELGRSVKAVVRSLADEELVIAQGQENSAREDLSYIEKARFAKRLQERFARETIMRAMSVYKSDLSNMLSVVGRIPEDIIDAIGPAPAIGRRGWIELAEHLAKTGVPETVRALAKSAELLALGSNERFKRVFNSVRPQAKRGQSEAWSTSDGKKLAEVVQDPKKLTLTIDRRAAPEFAEFVLARLRLLFEKSQVERSSRL